MLQHLHRISIVVMLCLTSAVSALGSSGNGGLLKSLSQPPDYQSERASSTDPDWQHGNGDSRPIAPGATLVLANLQGPGEITHIWNTVADNERYYSRLLVLRMYWDGEKQPSVECPLGDFFGVGHGIDANLDSYVVRDTSDGRARNCYWIMPFHTSALITVTNEGHLPVNAFYYHIDWRKLSHMARNTATFHAEYRQEFPCTAGKNYVIADITGMGKYVGTVLSVKQLTSGWWGEGNDYFYVDGETVPSIKGTGTEDYFNDGWGLHEGTGLFTGTPIVEGTEAGDRTTAYRWHIPDPIAFHKSLRVEIQHMGVTFNPDGSVKTGFGERFDDYSSVAFWYQTGAHTPYPPMPYGYARLYSDDSAMIPGASLIQGAKASAGNIDSQDLGITPGPQLWWRPTDGNQSLALTLKVNKAGTYSLNVLFTYAHDYGTYKLLLDNKPLGGPIDFFHDGVIQHTLTFRNLTLTAGLHTLTFVGVGHNSNSTGYLFGIDGYLLATGKKS